MNTHPIPRPIKLLPPALRNQIAAGEVVERPASVLKELVENSLDAGATEIAVTLEDGGQTLLAVRDNGHGIAEADLELAVTRHATSKVASFDELLHVASYGFRGEALPSIASVAHLRVESAYAPAGVAHGNTLENSGPAGEPGTAAEGTMGAFVEVVHSNVVAAGPSALRYGTLVEVRDLFSNVPARLKFLKTPATELKRCQEALTRLALARPGVGFTLTAGNGLGKGRDLLRLSAGMDLRERLAQIWPAQVTEGLVPFSGTRHDIRVHGLASLPQSAQARGDRMFLYVNNRPVNDRLLLRAVREAYKGRLTSREYPQIVLFLEIDPQEVDVNVHPAKSEIRFRDERPVFGAVLRILESAITAHSPGFFPGTLAEDTPGLASNNAQSPGAVQAELPPLYSGGLPGPLSRPTRPDGFWGTLDAPRVVDFTNKQDSDDELPESTPSEGTGYEAIHSVPSMPFGVRESASAYLPESMRPPVPVSEDTAGGTASAARVLLPAAGAGIAADNEPEAAAMRDPFASEQTPPATFAFSAANGKTGGYPITVGPFVCLGQVAETYLILVQGDTLLLLDQHAAHERVLLHTIEKQAAGSQSQLLALPVELPLHPSESARLQERFGQLTRLGYALSTRGTQAVSVTGLPPLLGRTQGLALLRDILADKTDGLDDLLHLMACRSAIKAGQQLTADEAAALLEQWMATPDCHFCPHGRPTVLALGPGDLEKMFKRKIG